MAYIFSDGDPGGKKRRPDSLMTFVIVDEEKEEDELTEGMPVTIFWR